MSYAGKELSQQDAAPVRLVRFVQGATTWYYTTRAASITIGGNVYVPGVISTESVVATGDVPKDPLILKMPYTNALAASFVASPPDAVTAVTVFRCHADDTETRIEWMGRASGASVTGATVSITCESVFSSMQRPGLRETYQRLCRRRLGGEGCNVTRANFTADCHMTAVSGNAVTFSQPLTENCVGGDIVASDGTMRMIIGQATDGLSVTLMRPLRGLATMIAAIEPPATYAEVTIQLGCDRSTTTCDTRFHNLANFGGFPGIPWINPMTNISYIF